MFDITDNDYPYHLKSSPKAFNGLRFINGGLNICYLNVAINSLLRCDIIRHLMESNKDPLLSNFNTLDIDGQDNSLVALRDLIGFNQMKYNRFIMHDTIEAIEAISEYSENLQNLTQISWIKTPYRLRTFFVRVFENLFG